MFAISVGYRNWLGWNTLLIRLVSIVRVNTTLCMAVALGICVVTENMHLVSIVMDNMV